MGPLQPMGANESMFFDSKPCVKCFTFFFFFFFFLCVDCQLAKLLCLPDGIYISRGEASNAGQMLWLEQGKRYPEKILYGPLMVIKEIPDLGHARQESRSLQADFLNGLMYLLQIKPFSTSGRSARSRLGRSSKRLVVDQLFSRCKRTGGKQKGRCLPKSRSKQKTNPKHKQANTQQRKTSRNLSETLRFQKNKILERLSTSSRRHSNYRK